MHLTDAILITGLEFYGYHGVTAEEQAVGHRYQVDLTLGVDTREAGASDHVDDTVNYAEVTVAILSIGTQEQFRLLEALAQRIVDVLFDRFPRINSITVRVQKRLPPLDAVVQSVGVEIMRTRHETDRAEKHA